MALQKREKILAASTGALLVVTAVFYLMSGGSSTSSISQLNRQYDDLTVEVAEKQQQADRLEKYETQLDELENRSLPSNHEMARSLYQKWLRELVFTRVRFRDAKVDPGEPQPRANYWKLRFTVIANGTLTQLTEFLHGFYSVDHLHKIVRLTAKPLGESETLVLVISIDALSMPGATRVDTLSKEPGNRLALSALEDYREVIVRRRVEEDRFVDTGGLFASYVPERRPPPDPPPRDDRPPEPKPPGFDIAKYTKVTATIAEDGRPEVWFGIKPTGKRLVLYEGDPFEVGPVSGTVVKIEPRRRYVIIEVDGRQHRLELGDSLEGVAEGSDEKA